MLAAEFYLLGTRIAPGQDVTATPATMDQPCRRCLALDVLRVAKSSGQSWHRIHHTWQANLKLQAVVRTTTLSNPATRWGFSS